MRDLDLTTLRLFVTVCETGNMRRAADEASMVASAVSKRLAQLEDTVGAQLLLRKRHGVAPTPAGETLLQHARSMLMSARLIERDMRILEAIVRFLSRFSKTLARYKAEAVVRECLEELEAPVSARECVWRSVTPWGTELGWWIVDLPEDAIQPDEGSLLPQKIEGVSGIVELRSAPVLPAPLPVMRSARPTTTMTVAMKNGAGSQFLRQTLSRIGVKMMAKLMMRPAFVAEVNCTPEVSSESTVTCPSPKPTLMKISLR